MNVKPIRYKNPVDGATQMLHRLRDLFEKYEVEQGDWMSLAVKLALRYEPAFRLEPEGKKKKTKPTKWHDMRLLQWWWEVTSYRGSHPGQTIESACHRVSQLDHWAQFRAGRAHYYEALKSPFVQWFVNVRQRLGIDKFAATVPDLGKLATDADAIGMTNFNTSRQKLPKSNKD